MYYFNYYNSYLEPKYYYKMIINPLYELAILGDGGFFPLIEIII